MFFCKYSERCIIIIIGFIVFLGIWVLTKVRRIVIFVIITRYHNACFKVNSLITTKRKDNHLVKLLIHSCIFSVRLDLGSILGGLANQGQQNNNNNNNQNKDPLGTLINQGIQLVATNPDVQQGILNAAGVNIQVPKPNRPNPVTTTQGIHFCDYISLTSII